MNIPTLAWTRQRVADLFSPRRNNKQAKRPSRPRYRPTLEILEARLAPATLLVTNTEDAFKVTGGDMRGSVPVDGSLRAEILAAAPGDTINFAPTLNGATISTFGALILSKNVTIDALGSGITVRGNNTFGIFVVNSGVTATLSGIAISGGEADFGGGIRNDGTLTVQKCTLTGNLANFIGGGIDNAGTLTVQNSTLSDNYAAEGGGIDNAGTLTVQNSTLTGNSTLGVRLVGGGLYNGGGIMNRGTLMVQNSTLSGNSTDGFGGGIGNYLGTLTVQNSTLSGNSSENNGGGIGNLGTLTVQYSTLSGNSSRSGGGGGISNGNILNGGTLTVQNSTIQFNKALYAAGIFNRGGSTTTVQNSTLFGNSASFTGGGILNEGKATVQNSTLTGNSARDGSGVYNSGTLTVQDSTLFRNSATRADGGGIENARYGVLNLGNTIVAGNTAQGSGPDISGTVTSQGHNLIGDGTGSSGLTNGVMSDQVGNSASPLDPRLGPLQNNGGPTLTFALLPGSPAIDAGDVAIFNAAGLRTDQRGTGFARTFGGKVDIGAYQHVGAIAHQGQPLVIGISETSSVPAPATTLTATQLFVTYVYETLLGRTPDPAGLADYTAALASGALTKAQFVQAITQSNEYLTKQINQIYEQLLGRPADPSGLQGGFAFLKNPGDTLQQLAASILVSPEFVADAELANPGLGANDAIITRFYEKVLGRDPSQAELDSYVDANGNLEFGSSLIAIATGFLDGQEYSGDLATLFYQQLLGRAPDALGLALYTSQLEKNASTSSILAGFLASPEAFTNLFQSVVGVASSSQAPVTGQAVTFTATVHPKVAGLLTPFGSVTLSVDGSPLSTSTLDANGQATFTTSALAAGSHTITASYNGDPDLLPSNSTLTQVVNPDPTTVVLISSLPTSNPGDMVRFTASVTANAPGSGEPTGFVTFFEDGILAKQVMLLNGQAEFDTNGLTAGRHTIVASYGGDSNFSGGSAKLTQTVNLLPPPLTIAPPTVTGVVPSSGPLAGGNSVTISGSGFTGATTVNFGAVPATGVTVVSDSQITAIAPAGMAGMVDITVTSPSGTSAVSPADQYTYDPLPMILNISPTSASHSGGTSVTIIGMNFTSVVAVDFGGGNPATTFTVMSSSQIVATSPPHMLVMTTGMFFMSVTVDVRVITTSGISPIVTGMGMSMGTGDQFTYT